MSIKSLDCVQDHNIGNSEYDLPKTPDSPYVIDDSNFIPMAEAVKQLGVWNQSTADSLKSFYDFPDGTDTGIEVPLSRTKNGKDIAEISSAIMEKVDELSDKVQKAKEFEQFKAQKAAEMQNIKTEKPSD